MTVLGRQLSNPYSVANMTKAWNNIYGQSVTALPPTDLYVRFLPENEEELFRLLALEESLDLDFDDYPLDYEVVEEGGYYHDPSIPEGRPTWLYTVVKPDFEAPAGIQYEVLSPLVLTKYYSFLTAEAFRITGNDYDEEGWDDDPIFSPCTTDCPNYPCCLDPDIECDDIPCPNPCAFDDPCYPNCEDCDNPPPPTGGGQFVANSCGCVVFSDPKKPGGCIKVTDTQLGDLGVKHLKVVVKDGMFKRITTETDNSGCWRVNERHSGRVKVKIKFENDKGKFRAMREFTTLQIASVLKDKHIMEGPPYNNLSVVYQPDNTNEHSDERAYWYAATGNNALHEYYTFADQDGVGHPPNGLDILLTPFGSAGAAPMFNEMAQNPSIYMEGGLGTFGLGSLMGFNMAHPLFGEVMNFLGPIIILWAPDVIYNHDTEFIAFDDVGSDQVKDTWYHEFGHAAHFEALNNDSYWQANSLFIATHNGYGDGTHNNSSRCAAIEMWGFFIGPVYADRRYGLNHSNTLSTNPITIERRRHIFLLEEFIPVPAGTPESIDWIPQGAFLDCLDNNSMNPTGVTEGISLDDISGFSVSQCFNAMSSSPQTVTDVKNNLKNTLPSGVTPGQVDAVFTLYGF